MLVTVAPDFSTYDNLGLVLAYNEIARELRSVGIIVPDRKGFRSKTAGTAECNKLWAAVQELKHRGKKTMDEMNSTDTIPDLPTVPATKPKRASTKKGPPGTNPKKAKAAKAAPKAKKAKAAKESNGTGHRGRAPLYPDSAKIKVLTKDDPTREGTSSREYWNALKGSKTFGDYRAAGGNLKYAYWFQDRGHITIG